MHANETSVSITDRNVHMSYESVADKYVHVSSVGD